MKQLHSFLWTCSKILFVVLVFSLYLPGRVFAQQAGSPDDAAIARGNEYLRLESMEIIGRIEAPLVKLDMAWQSPNFLSKSVANPDRTFQKEITGSFTGKSFFKYKNRLLKKRKQLIKNEFTRRLAQK